MILERTGDGCWCLKGTDVRVDSVMWFRLDGEGSDEDDEFSLSGA